MAKWFKEMFETVYTYLFMRDVYKKNKEIKKMIAECVAYSNDLENDPQWQKQRPKLGANPELN